MANGFGRRDIGSEVVGLRRHPKSKRLRRRLHRDRYGYRASGAGMTRRAIMNGSRAIGKFLRAKDMLGSPIRSIRVLAFRSAVIGS